MADITVEPVRKDGLCHACRRIFSVVEYPPVYHQDDENHRTAAECQSAALKGCFICHTVWQHATEHGQLDILALLTEGTFSRYGISINGKPALVNASKLNFNGNFVREWCPDGGLALGTHERNLVYSRAYSRSGPWAVTISFWSIGVARNFDWARKWDQCQVHFVLEPFKSKTLTLVSTFDTNQVCRAPRAC